MYTTTPSVRVDGVGKNVWNCLLIVGFYCCSIPERKDMTYVKHDIAVTRPCVSCLVVMNDISHLQNEGSATAETDHACEREIGSFNEKR